MNVASRVAARAVQHGRNEIVVEHDLFVRPAFDDMRERQARIGLRDVACQQAPRAERPDFEHRRLTGVDREIARLPLAHAVSRQAVRRRRRARLPDPRRGEAAPQERAPDRAPARRCRSARAADRLRACGTASRRETRRTARRSANLPMLNRSRSSSISVNPQLYGGQRLAAGFDVSLEVAILLLKMLGL